MNVLGLAFLLVGAVMNFASSWLAQKWGKPNKQQERKTVLQVIGLVLAIIGALLIFEII